MPNWNYFQATELQSLPTRQSEISHVSNNYLFSLTLVCCASHAAMVYLQSTPTILCTSGTCTHLLRESFLLSFIGPKFITDVISVPEAGKNTVVQAMLRVAISENTKMNKWWKILISFCPFHKMLEIHQNFSLVLKKTDLKVFSPFQNQKHFSRFVRLPRIF